MGGAWPTKDYCKNINEGASKWRGGGIDLESSTAVHRSRKLTSSWSKEVRDRSGERKESAKQAVANLLPAKTSRQTPAALRATADR